MLMVQFEEVKCYEILRRIRWPSGIRCPSCAGDRVTIHTKSPTMPRRRYLCLGCRRTFTDLTGTPFARTNLPLSRWFRCLRRMEEDCTTSELARSLEVKWDTAAHLRSQITLALREPGIVRQLCQAAQGDGE